MQLSTELRPHIKSKDTTNIIMLDVLIAMMFIVILSCLYFGFRALIIVLVSVISCYILDMISVSIRSKIIIFPDISSVVTGFIIAMLMPINIPIYVLVITCVFSILIVKQCFGGLGQNIFNPAAGGFVFSSLCFQQELFKYPVPDISTISNKAEVIVSDNVSSILKLGNHPVIQITDMLLGKQPGPIGTIHILVIISCVMWLIVRKSVYWPAILSFIMTCGIFAFMFPRIYSFRVMSMLYEIFSGSLLFGAVFMITDPVTAPKYNVAKVVYSGLIGVFTMIFRYFGSFPQGICFAIILGNILSFYLDRYIYKYIKKIKRI